MWAISFSNNDGSLLTGAISIVITIISMCIWDLVCYWVMFFRFRHPLRRVVGLVMMWNANDPGAALKHMLAYSVYYSRIPSDFFFGITIATVALVIYLGSMLVGVFAPQLIQVGNVAPARPSGIFYPAASSNNNTA